MSLKIIGVGFGRTGTYSMKLALEQLGFGPCHHMYEVIGQKGQAQYWQAAKEGKLTDWQTVFQGFQATVDWPGAAFWQQITDTFPDARVLLTIRSPESWYNSISKTIFPYLEQRLADLPSGYGGEVVRMAHELIIGGVFAGNITDRDHVISVYNTHNKEVMATVPKERLLVHQLGEGWEPLCNWLNVPIPETDYPKRNSQEEFWEY